MWDGFNKRKFPRISVRCEITIQSDDKTPVIKTKTENLGLGGACVVIDRELKRFQNCKVSLELGSKKSRLDCDARIVWIVPVHKPKAKKSRFDTGIEFLNVEAPETRRLQAFLGVGESEK